jgi:hypothetical protein
MTIINRHTKETVISDATDGTITAMPETTELVGVDAAGTETFTTAQHVLRTKDGRAQVVTPATPVFWCASCRQGPLSKEGTQYCSNLRCAAIVCRPCSRHADNVVFCRGHYWRHQLEKFLRWLSPTK